MGNFAFPFLSESRYIDQTPQPRSAILGTIPPTEVAGVLSGNRGSSELNRWKFVWKSPGHSPRRHNGSAGPKVLILSSVNKQRCPDIVSLCGNSPRRMERKQKERGRMGGREAKTDTKREGGIAVESAWREEHMGAATEVAPPYRQQEEVPDMPF